MAKIYGVENGKYIVAGEMDIASEGGRGSGNFGHSGVVGQRGGSAPGGGAAGSGKSEKSSSGKKRVSGSGSETNDDKVKAAHQKRIAPDRKKVEDAMSAVDKASSDRVKAIEAYEKNPTNENEKKFKDSEKALNSAHDEHDRAMENLKQKDPAAAREYSKDPSDKKHSPASKRRNSGASGKKQTTKAAIKDMNLSDLKSLANKMGVDVESMNEDKLRATILSVMKNK